MSSFFSGKDSKCYEKCIFEVENLHIPFLYSTFAFTKS